jgi:SAM-dependent methyltransferase/acyl carrier protein
VPAAPPFWNATQLGLNGTIQALRELLDANVALAKRADSIGPDEPLFGTGVGLDSLQGLTLLTLIERHFGVTINELDWSVHEIGTLTRLAGCVLNVADEQRRLERSLGGSESWFVEPMGLEDLPQGVRYPHLAIPESIVERYIARYSRPGDLVLDPFAGFGSTLVVAERLGRRACGIELDPERHARASARVTKRTSLVLGDARDIGRFGLPAADLCFTGPPFFASDRLLSMDVPALADTYEAYLTDLQVVFRGVRDLLRPGGYLVTQFANLQVEAGFRGAGSPPGLLPLAWDAARVIDPLLPLMRDEIWCIAPGERPGPFSGRHGYFLIFRRPEEPNG